jgi:hypothetical protein
LGLFSQGGVRIFTANAPAGSSLRLKASRMYAVLSEKRNRMEDDDFNFELMHGIRLSVREDDGVIDIHHLSGFLANAMNVFKSQRDAIPSDSLVNEPFSEIVRDESNAAVGTITLRFPGDQGLPVAFWVKAVIDAYTKASTLEPAGRQ